MITKKEDAIHFIKTQPIAVIKQTKVDTNSHFDSKLLEDPEVGGEFFARSPLQFTSFLSVRKYEKDYFLSIYQKMHDIKQIIEIDTIFSWTYEVINAENDGKHYFNDPEFILQLFEIDPEIIYVADEEVITSEFFLLKSKNKLLKMFEGYSPVHDIEKTLFNLVNNLQREEFLHQIIKDSNNHNKANTSIKKRKL